MQVDTYIDRRVLYIRLHGDIDEYGYTKVREQIDTAIESSFFDKVIFDFCEVTFMDSTGIGMLIGRYKKLKQFKKPAYIQDCNAQVDKLLSMSGIFTIMPKLERSQRT